jgi:hypothetical protein
MLRTLIGAAAAMLLSAAAQAQITGPIPNTQQDSGGMDWTKFPILTGRARTPEEAGREVEIEQKYQETLRTKIPDKKPARDPWKNLRQTPAAVDRHRAQF